MWEKSGGIFIEVKLNLYNKFQKTIKKLSYFIVFYMFLYIYNYDKIFYAAIGFVMIFNFISNVDYLRKWSTNYKKFHKK